VSQLISVLTPVYDPPESILKAAIRSVLDQDYPNFELCLVDDASSGPHVRRLLEEASRNDPRVRVMFRNENGGIVAASNDALSLATGTFVALLDHDDLLEPNALGAVNHHLELGGDDADYLYTDEDQLDLDGQFVNAFFKPDWSPERLRSQMYTCHLSVIRTSLAREVGGFRAEFNGSQDYDLVLRVTERARRVVHIPEVLYHWRMLPTSTANNASAKPFAYDAGVRAVKSHCDRVGLRAEVEKLNLPGTHHVRREVIGEPKVSIVIPTGGTKRRVWGRDRVLVVEAVRSIIERSSYRNIEFVIVVDETIDPSVIAALEELLGSRLRLVWFREEFHFSRKTNLGAANATGDFYLLMNDDMEVITGDWLEELIGLVQHTDAGMVGCKLLFADGTLQHAGHVYSDSRPHHSFFRYPATEPGPSCLLQITRECSGVTAACALVPAKVWHEVGGLSEELPNNFNDVDFSLKIRHLGYRILWTPHAQLFHFESMSRDTTVTPDELRFIQTRWDAQLRTDPYSNPNFDPMRSDSVRRFPSYSK
jgi:O-antigen biosynthesis protein